MSTVFWLAIHKGDSFQVIEEEDFTACKYLIEELDQLSRELGLTPLTDFILEPDYESEEDLLEDPDWKDPRACLTVVEGLAKAAGTYEPILVALEKNFSIPLQELEADLLLMQKRLGEAAANGHRIRFWDTC